MIIRRIRTEWMQAHPVLQYTRLFPGIPNIRLLPDLVEDILVELGLRSASDLQ